MGEAAAFIAALSRALASPAGAPYRSRGADALVWAAEDGLAVYLTPTALRVTVEVFGTPDAQPVLLASVPASCRPLYGAGEIPAWGTDAARSRLTQI